MSLSIVFYILAVICFFLACIDFPYSGKMVPIGLMFFAAGHLISGVTLKSG